MSDNIYQTDPILDQKIGVFSDIHLGLGQDSENWHKIMLEFAEWAAKTYREKGITDVTSYAGTTIPYRRYDSSMVYKTTGTYSHRQALGNLPARPQWAAKPNLYYQPASRQCIIDTERLNIAYTSRYRGNASINAYELIATEIPTGSTPNIVPFKFKILVRFAYPANSTKNYEQAISSLVSAVRSRDIFTFRSLHFKNRTNFQ